MIEFIGDLLTCLLMLTGAAFSLIAAVGIVRMPDLYTRMQAAAKTATLGVGCTILGVAIHFSDAGVTAQAALVIIFLFLTAPVAAHMISRAGYISGVELWERSVTDERQGGDDFDGHERTSGRQSLPAQGPDSGGGS